MKPAPWSADNGLAATASRLRSVDISHLSVDISRWAWSPFTFTRSFVWQSSFPEPSPTLPRSRCG